MAKVELKQPIVDEIAGNLKDAAGVVLCEYRGITVEQDTRLRKQLREAGVKYKVYKNTLVKRAIEGSAFESLSGDLTGPTAMAISETDATAPARILSNFAKEAEALVLKSGVVEGNYYGTDEIRQLATIPSREELLSKLLGSIQSPIANFARVVQQIADKVASGEPLEAEKPAEEAPAAEAEAPAEEAPAAEAEAPAEEAPAAEAEAPAEEAPAAEAEAPADDAPAAEAETPAEDAPAEEEKPAE